MTSRPVERLKKTLARVAKETAWRKSGFAVGYLFWHFAEF